MIFFSRAPRILIQGLAATVAVEERDMRIANTCRLPAAGIAITKNLARRRELSSRESGRDDLAVPATNVAELVQSQKRHSPYGCTAY